MQSNQHLSSSEDATNTNDDDLDTTWDEELFRAVKLKVAKSKGNLETHILHLVKVYLRAKANINAQDENGDTALHIAIKKNYQKIIKCLLQRNARTDIRNHEGYTVMTLRETLQNKDILTLLNDTNKLPSGADASSSSRKSDATSMADGNQERSTWRGDDIGIQRSPNTVEDGCPNLKTEPHSIGRDETVEKNLASFGLENTYCAGDAIQRNWGGFYYQLLHLELTLHRALQKNTVFFLATEMVAAGKLDDVVLLYTNDNKDLVGLFKQVKYSDQATKKLSVKELFEDNGAFSLPKYFITQRKVKKNKLFSEIQVRIMTLCTNRDLHVDDLKDKNINYELVPAPDESFKIENETKTTAWYKFLADGKVNEEFYNRLKQGIVRCSAMTLAEYIYDSKPTTLGNDFAQDHHLLLVRHIFDAKIKNLHHKFIDDKHLFCETFFSEYKRRAKISKSNTSEQNKVEIPESLDEVFEIWSKHKLLATYDVPDDIDGEEISDFLKEFTLEVNQPNLHELDEIIETSNNTLLNPLRADQISIFLPKILKWFLDEGKRGNDIEYLSYEVCEKFLDDMKFNISSCVTSGLIALYCETMKSYDIHFKSDIEEVKNLLTIERSDPKYHQIMQLVVSPEETLLYGLWAYDTLRNITKYTKSNSHISIPFNDLKHSRIMDQVKRTFESPDYPDLLLVDFGSGSEPVQDHTLLKPLVKIIKKNTNKKMIIITREGCHLDLATPLEVRVSKQKNEINFDNLTDDSRKKLLGKRVTEFQGQKIETSFGELLGIPKSNSLSAEELKDLSQTIDSDVLVELIRCDELKIGEPIGDDIEREGMREIEKYHIKRTIYQRVIIEEDILSDLEATDLLAISGIDRDASDTLGQVGNVSRTDQNITKYTILNRTREVKDFKDLCANNESCNIHWLKKLESGEYIWKQSRGDITYLFKYRSATGDENEYSNDMESATNLEENILADQSKPVIISDEAGMGKSIILIHLAQELKKQNPVSLVLKINLNCYSTAFKDAKTNYDLTIIEQVIKFLMKELLSHESDLAKKVFQRIIMNVTKPLSQRLIDKHGGVAFLFDGFDEISPLYDDAVIDFLQTLTKHDLTKIVVTTRPCTSEKLERKLNAFSYQICPFSEINQEDFLTMFWTAKLNLDSAQKTKDRLKTYTEAIIMKLAVSIQDYRNKLTGNPLQVKLVAEIFTSPIEGEQKDFDTCKEFIKSNAIHPNIPKRLNLIYLYQKFVHQMLARNFRKRETGERSNSNDPTVIEDRDDCDNIAINRYKKMALYELFDKDTAEALLPHVEIKSDITIQRTGIITKFIDGRPHFGHQTYAEYFAATFFSDTLKKGKPKRSVKKILATKILLLEEYSTMRAFLNSLLSSKHHNAFRGESWESYLDNDEKKFYANIFHVAVKEGNGRILEMILNLNRKDLIYTKDCLESTIFEQAIQGGYVDEFKILVEHTKCEINTAIDEDNQLSLLHHATMFGKLDIVQYLLDKNADINARSYTLGQTPLFLAVAGAKFDKIKTQLKNLISERNKLPIICSPERLKLVKYLVDKRADVNLSSSDGATPLHLAAQIGELEMVKYLVDEGQADVNLQANNGSTALYAAAASRKFDKMTWSKYPNDEILMPVATPGSQLAIVKYLFKRGAKLKCQDKEGWTPLHAASAIGNLKVVKYLVDNKVEVNTECHKGKTPLHVAAQEGQLDIVQYLLNKGANVKYSDNDGHAPIHVAVINGRLEVVEYLLDRGVDINLTSEFEVTPLLVAYLYGKSDIVKCLVERGARRLSENQWSFIKRNRDRKC